MRTSTTTGYRLRATGGCRLARLYFALLHVGGISPPCHLNVTSRATNVYRTNYHTPVDSQAPLPFPPSSLHRVVALFACHGEHSGVSLFSARLGTHTTTRLSEHSSSISDPTTFNIFASLSSPSSDALQASVTTNTPFPRGIKTLLVDATPGLGTPLPTFEPASALAGRCTNRRLARCRDWTLVCACCGPRTGYTSGR